MSVTESPTPHDEIERLVMLVRRERRRRVFAAVESLWRIGDGVRRLRRRAGAGAWGTTLEMSAARAGMGPASLDEAARVAQVFDLAERRALRDRLVHAATIVLPSHIIELARAPPRARERGIEALIREPLTVRELRYHLRRRIP